MRPPEVLLDNSDDVYAFYREHRQNRLQAMGAYALLGRRYRPRVAYATGAREAIGALIRSRTPLLIAVNHLSRLDPYTLAAAAWRSELRPIIGRTRVLAKDELFEEAKLRRRIDMMGGIPVFRGRDHGLRAVNAAGQRMMDICAERLAGGDSLAILVTAHAPTRRSSRPRSRRKRRASTSECPEPNCRPGPRRSPGWFAPICNRPSTAPWPPTETSSAVLRGAL
jgi:hypothetical protein